MAGCGRGAPWDTARVQWNGMPWNTLQSRASRARSQDFCAAVRRKNNGICLRYRRSPPCGLSKISRQHAAHNCPAPSRYPSRRSMGTVRRYGVSPPHRTHFSRAPAVCPDSARLRFRCAMDQTHRSRPSSCFPVPDTPAEPLHTVGFPLHCPRIPDSRWAASPPSGWRWRSSTHVPRDKSTRLVFASPALPYPASGPRSAWDATA